MEIEGAQDSWQIYHKALALVKIFNVRFRFPYGNLEFTYTMGFTNMTNRDYIYGLHASYGI